MYFVDFETKQIIMVLISYLKENPKKVEEIISEKTGKKVSIEKVCDALCQVTGQASALNDQLQK